MEVYDLLNQHLYKGLVLTAKRAAATDQPTEANEHKSYCEEIEGQSYVEVALEGIIARSHMVFIRLFLLNV